MKALLCGAALLFATVASAQFPIIGGLRGRIGYFWTPDFDTSLGSRSMRGLEFGVDWPILYVAGLSVAFSPSAGYGGSLGGGLSGNIYKLGFSARKAVPLTRFVAMGQAGYGWVQSRGGWTGADNGLYGELGLGYALSAGALPVKPMLELRYRFGERQLSGPYVGFSLGF